MTMTSAWPMILTPATRTLRPNAARIANKIMPSMDVSCAGGSAGCLVLPVRDEDVRFTGLRVGAIRGPHESSPVRAELREAVELRVGGHLFQPRAVDVDEVQVKITAARILVIRRENDPRTIGSEERSEVGAAEVGDLTLVRAIGVHDPDLHLVRADHLLAEEIAVGAKLGRVGRMVGAIHDLASVGREEWPSVISRSGREAPDIGPV